MKTTLCFLVLLGLFIRPAVAATLQVTNVTDRGAGTLRAALAKAAAGDTIRFKVTGTIKLTQGELRVTKSVTILGPGPAALAVDGNAVGRVFVIAPETIVNIAGLTVTNGVAVADGGGIYNDHATLTLSNCHFVGNTAKSGGSAIYNDGYFGAGVYRPANLTVSHCVFNDNTAACIVNFGSYGNATLTISASTFNGQTAQTAADRGGIKNIGTGGQTELAISGGEGLSLSQK